MKAITVLALIQNRYAHMGYKSLNELIRKNMVYGLNTDRFCESVEKKCRVCIQSKQTTLPYSKTILNRSSRPLELVHTDICGNITPESYTGDKYFLTFIDDFTGFKAVYILKRKSEMIQYLSEYEKQVNSWFGHRIAVLRCDQGGEYKSVEFQSLCKRKGIRIQYTSAYDFPLNRVAERANRTIAERARAMLLESEAPKELWPEAVRASVYMLNRSPSAAIKEAKTPAALFYRKKPDVGRLRTFGCFAYKLIPKQFRNKFDPKSDRLLFVGYTDSGYRLWDPVRRKICFARNVVFDETKTFADLVQQKDN